MASRMGADLQLLRHIAGGVSKGLETLPDLLGEGGDLIRTHDEQDHHEDDQKLSESQLQVRFLLLKYLFAA